MKKKFIVLALSMLLCLALLPLNVFSQPVGPTDEHLSATYNPITGALRITAGGLQNGMHVAALAEALSGEPLAAPVGMSVADGAFDVTIEDLDLEEGEAFYITLSRFVGGAPPFEQVDTITWWFEAPEITATSLALPGGMVGVAYSHEVIFTAFPGLNFSPVPKSPSFSYTLPAGLIFDEATHTISGTPSEAGAISVTVTYNGAPLTFSGIIAPSANTTLTGLTVTPGTLYPAFAPSTVQYSVEVEYDVTSITLAAAANPLATGITGDIGTRTLAVGPNEFTITVTAANGDTQNYYVTVIRAAREESSDATLSALNVSAGTLSPAFSPAIRAYSVTVGNTVASITLEATANCENATIEGDGAHNLVVGANPITVTVTAEDDTKLEYVVTVTRNTPSGGDTTTTPPSTPTPAGSATVARMNENETARFTAVLTDRDVDASIQLYQYDAALPEEFLEEILARDSINELFLNYEMHNFAVEQGGEVTDDIQAIISVYVGDLSLSDVQRLMFRGFVFNLETEEYEVISGAFSDCGDFFYFELYASGLIGVMVYELPAPLLRLTIDSYSYYYNGALLTSDVAPFLSGGRTMVPLRLVAEALGATPRWDDATATAYIYKNGVVLSLPMGQPLPGGLGVPVLINGRVLVPLRYVIENFDAITLWHEDVMEVTVFVR